MSGGEKKSAAVRSMLTIALYLILLIGMWSVLGRLIFPAETDLARAKSLAKNNAPLLKQVAENSLNPETWAGIYETETVQELLSSANIAYVETEGEITRFYMKNSDPDATHALVYPHSGVYAPPQGREWTAAGAKNAGETAYESGGARATATALENGFYYEEATLPA